MKSFLAALLLIMVVGCDAIFEKDLLDQRVEVISPVDGVTVDSGRVAFLWRAVDGARGYRLIVVSPSFGIAGRVAVDTLLDSLTRCEVVLVEGDYQWSIEAFNSAYTTTSRISNLKIK